VGLKLPMRSAAPVRRVVTAAVLGTTVLVLGACSAEDQDQIGRLAMPEPITEQAPYTFDLWKWAWVAAIVVGVIVWGLIFWVVVRYRRKHDDEVPVQTRYNLPLEIFYTIAPILMVVVFFYWTVNVQNKMIEMDPEPDVTIEVVGQQWSWTFNHGVGEPDPDADPLEGRFAYDSYGYTAGTASQIPTLVLPVDQKVQFNLWSPDVIHSFGIPNFLMKLDVVPGRVNQFQATPTVEGDYVGKCFELCGTYHSRMLFNVKVVSQSEYEEYVDTLEQSEEPLLGGADAYTQAGLAEDDDEEGSEQ
jgi:cytochrome c oxidase subunit 2